MQLLRARHAWNQTQVWSSDQRTSKARWCERSLAEGVSKMSSCTFSGSWTPIVSSAGAKVALLVVCFELSSICSDAVGIAV